MRGRSGKRERDDDERYREKHDEKHRVRDGKREREGEKEDV